MQKLFQEVVELGITGGGIIPVILFIRFFLRHSPGTFSYLLWSIPAVRLTFPVSFSGIWGILADTKVGGRVENLSGIQVRIITGGQRQAIPDQAAEWLHKQGIMTCMAIIWELEPC